jgi:hypothetical protein
VKAAVLKNRAVVRSDDGRLGFAIKFGCWVPKPANALKFVDHPKARQFDVRQSFDNSFIDEAMR